MSMILPRKTTLLGVKKFKNTNNNIIGTYLFKYYLPDEIKYS